VKEDLQKHVAELFAHQLVFPETDRVIELVRLFYQIRTQRFMGLSGVPFAAGPEIPHESEGVVEGK
jgi:hypothetical protein